MSAPHEPRLAVGSSGSVNYRNRGDCQPNNEHVPAQTLADFAYEEIRIGESHTSADDRDRDTLVPSRDSRECSLRGEFKRDGGLIQVFRYDQSPGWRSHCDLRHIDAETGR